MFSSLASTACWSRNSKKVCSVILPFWILLVDISCCFARIHSCLLEMLHQGYPHCSNLWSVMMLTVPGSKFMGNIAALWATDHNFWWEVPSANSDWAQHWKKHAVGKLDNLTGLLRQWHVQVSEFHDRWQYHKVRRAISLQKDKDQ